MATCSTCGVAYPDDDYCPACMERSPWWYWSVRNNYDNCLATDHWPHAESLEIQLSDTVVEVLCDHPRWGVYTFAGRPKRRGRPPVCAAHMAMSVVVMAVLGLSSRKSCVWLNERCPYPDTVAVTMVTWMKSDIAASIMLDLVAETAQACPGDPGRITVDGETVEQAVARLTPGAGRLRTRAEKARRCEVLSRAVAVNLRLAATSIREGWPVERWPAVEGDAHRDTKLDNVPAAPGADRKLAEHPSQYMEF